MKNKFILLWLGISASFVFFLPIISSLTNPWNRLEITWTLFDPIAVSLLFFLWGTLIAAGAEIVKWVLRSNVHKDRIILLFLFILVWPGINSISLVKTIPWNRFSMAYPDLMVSFFFRIEEFFKLILIVVFGFFSIRHSKPTKIFMLTALKIISPSVLIFLWQLFSYPKFPTVSQNPPHKVNSINTITTPVFIFLFDEWSYGSIANREKLPDFYPSINSVLDESTVFHEAVSPGTSTNESVPYLIGEPVYQNFGKGGSSVFVPERSIFEKAQKHGWKNTVVGCYLPYAFWFGNFSEYAQQIPSYKSPYGGFLDTLISHAQIGFFASLAQWLNKLNGPLYSPYAVKIQRQRVFVMENLMSSFLRTSTNDSFGYFHFSIPHDPFIGNAKSPVEAYNENIHLVDKVIGQITTILKENKLWDKSLVVITSDHGWRKAPFLKGLSEDEKNRYLRHVPCILKFPGQKTRVDIHKAQETILLKEFLRKGFETGHFMRSDFIGKEVTAHRK